MPIALLVVVLVACVALPAFGLDDAELDRRIHALRTADLAVRVVDRDGAAPAGAVRWRLVRHAFRFGTAIGAAPLGIPRMKEDGTVVAADAPADVARYQEILLAHFSCVVAENEMKWPFMERSDGTPYDDCAVAMYEWAAARGLAWRGHCGIWGVPRWLPDWQKALARQPAAEIETRVRARLEHVARLFAGRIADWDVANELLADDIWGKGLGRDAGADYFRWMEAVAPGQRWFVNEFKGLQDGTPEQIVALARRLIDAGAPVRGIGDQAHYHRPVPDADTLWRQLDVLGSLGLPVHITEFDLHYQGMTDADQAEQLRRFYRVCFAHPAVDAIMMWGFWERRHWRPKAALWRADWTIRPAGQAYIDLVSRDWTTTGEGPLAADGTLRFRGFPGTYRIEASGRAVEVRMLPGAAAVASIAAP